MPKAKEKVNKNSYLTFRFRKTTVRTVWFACLGVLLVGVIVWAALFSRQTHLVRATPAQIERAKRDISARYRLAETSCVQDNLDAAARTQSFDDHLQVNKYANRAVIRGCNDGDALLAFTKEGWVKTPVNIVLDARQNPTWQRACLIDDITTADDQVRPENSSIDSFNLDQCTYLRQNNSIKSL